MVRLAEARAVLRLARGAARAARGVNAEQLATILVALQVGDLVQPGLETGERSGIALVLVQILAHGGVAVRPSVVRESVCTALGMTAGASNSKLVPLKMRKRPSMSLLGLPKGFPVT